MRFTNLCGMTIPERMVALQDMMQELIDAIYAEYRWAAIVSHVSETNVFTANDVINFSNSDFIVGQTVLFTDGYLGVVIEVDNSKNPKQFTAGHYMQLKGDKGDNGTNGTNGKDGLDSLTYNSIYVTTSVPSTVISFPTMASNFNRPPVVGDVFNIVFRGAGSVLNRSWVGTYKVISLGIGVANCSGSVVETTGEKGPAGQPGEAGQGLVKRYMHSISYYEEGLLNVKFNIFLSDDHLYGTIDEFANFFTENHYDNADTSYPATGFYENEGVIYNVWGIYYSLDGVYYVQYGNNRNGVDISTSSDVSDIMVDLGS